MPRDTGYYVNPYSMGGEIDEVRERYHRLSPIEYCRRIDTPTLLLQGQDDQRCPLGQAEQMFANLVRCAAEPARMVVYPGGSHALAGTGRPSHRLDYHRRLAHLGARPGLMKKKARAAGMRRAPVLACDRISRRRLRRRSRPTATA